AATTAATRVARAVERVEDVGALVVGTRAVRLRPDAAVAAAGVVARALHVGRGAPAEVAVAGTTAAEVAARGPVEAGALAEGDVHALDLQARDQVVAGHLRQAHDRARVEHFDVPAGAQA